MDITSTFTLREMDFSVIFPYWCKSIIVSNIDTEFFSNPNAFLFHCIEIKFMEELYLFIIAAVCTAKDTIVTCYIFNLAYVIYSYTIYMYVVRCDLGSVAARWVLQIYSDLSCWPLTWTMLDIGNGFNRMDINYCYNIKCF